MPVSLGAPTRPIPARAWAAARGGAARPGRETVVIDPRMTPDAAKATVWLPIRPGTDVALQLCWVRYILEHKLYNAAFVMKWTNLPYLVNTRTGECWRAAKSTQKGVPDTFGWCGIRRRIGLSLCPTRGTTPLTRLWRGSWEWDGVVYKTGYQLLKERSALHAGGDRPDLLADAGEIEEAIRTFCENTPSGLCIGVATDQSPNSVQAAMGAAVIDMLMGNVEQPGSLLQRFGTQRHVFYPGFPIGFCDRKLPYEQLEKRLGGNEYKGLHMWHAAPPLLPSGAQDRKAPTPSRRGSTAPATSWRCWPTARSGWRPWTIWI